MQISILQLITITILLMQASPTLYSVSSDFTITFQRNYNQLAYATYQQTIYQKGWNYLHIYANDRKSLIEQHRGAGFIQGYVSYREIYSAYLNLVGGLIKSQNLNIKAQNFIDKQIQYIDDMVDKHPRELYWQYAGAYMQQLRYMYRGYLTRINIEKTHNTMYIGFNQFYYLTNQGDLQDLIPAFHNPSQMSSNIQQNLQKPQVNNIDVNVKSDKEDDKPNIKPGNCNGYVKLMDNKLYMAHSTHNIFQFLLRIYKTYHFPSRDINVGSQWFSFSSRPGDLISKDDFYVLSNGMVVMQTSLANMKKQNYNDLSPRTLPCWLRQTIAVNLARTGQEWIDYFLRQRSGTHNNQWLIIDKARLSTYKNVVLVVQQGFSQYQIMDKTSVLQSKGYVASYNIPYSTKIHKKLGYQNYPYTIDTEPRAGDFAKYNNMINNVQDMKKWLLNNDHQDNSTGLAPRYDLQQKGAYPFGLTDCKIISPEGFNGNYIWAISGPSMSNGRFAAFDWTNWPNNSHYGMPKKWNFTWEKYPMVQTSLVQQQMQVQHKNLQVLSFD